MRLSTVIMFAVAFLCAGFAALLIRGMIGASNGPAATVSAASLQKVVAAAKDLKPGDVLTAENMRELAWGSETMPKGAFGAKDALLTPGGRMVSALIAENEPITAGKLFDPGASVLAGRIREGMTGVTIRVNDSSSVGGFAQPDDRVDVIMTQTGNDNGMGGKAYAVTLLRNVRVLAVDQQTQRKAQPQPPKTVTLEATPEAAKKLTLAQAIGQLSLALTKGPSAEDDGGMIDLNDLVHRAPVPALPKENVDPLVTVTRSTERKDYQVPSESRTFSTRLESPLAHAN